MKYLPLLLILASCYTAHISETLSLIQIQDRNGLTETISNPERLVTYANTDFSSSQPYKKVLRVFKAENKKLSYLTTYHPNGLLWQYLEAEEMRAKGTYQEWFPNGQLKIKATLVGGIADTTPAAQETWLFDSLCQVWDEKGNLIADIPYQNGQLHDISTYYYPNGQIKSQVPFNKNLLEGELLEYFPSNTLRSRTTYRSNMKDGPAASFFATGAPASTEMYSEGYLLSGQYFTPDRKLLAGIENGGGFQASYDSTTLTLTEFCKGKPEGEVRILKNNLLHRLYHTKNTQKNGEEIEYYPNGCPKLSLVWQDNTIHGLTKTWYETGQQESERTYAHNQRSGPSLAWYPNGQLMLLEEYEQDLLISGQYYKLNKPDPVSTIINGTGIATLYDATGALLHKIQYIKSKPAEE